MEKVILSLFLIILRFTFYLVVGNVRNEPKLFSEFVLRQSGISTAGIKFPYMGRSMRKRVFGHMWTTFAVH